MSFLTVERSSPRVAGIFGTQQRYLLAQLASAMLFRSKDGTLHLSRFLEAVVAHRIASRNTAHDFIREMEKYGVIRPNLARDDKRSRPLKLVEETVGLLGVWVAIHLRTLDAFDNGSRAATFAETPGMLAQLHPAIVERILQSQRSTSPDGTFSLFTWMNDGGLVMDKMIATITDFSPQDGRIVTGIGSLDEIASALRVTKTHLSRKMAVAEREGSLGWTGKRGTSLLWLSPGFLEEYVAYQADKLGRVEEAYASLTVAVPA
ncbi:hypothetical protein [Rhizobium sp. C4]|uniref:hypothetical protein n=1 Tax=Rhizobium sp. C4 TaxID=1349800 RepID=UPI001E487F15|nr:hypothetical protein [Rhizobium sp. C4]MCD2171942.1 hypothetical protein [Rhizobium sp. C4]